MNDKEVLFRLGYSEGRSHFLRDPKGDPRGPYDGRTLSGKAWNRGWRDAHLEARESEKAAKTP